MAAPSPTVDQPGRLALCLSGGGYRAALFHLGVLRRLGELGLLGAVDTISSVSGGSLVAAFLADRLVRLGRSSLAELEPWDEVVGAPFHRLVGRDLRTGPILRHALWSWAAPGPRARAMVGQYRRHLTALPLTELPVSPRFVLCATDIAFGVNFIFSRERVGDYQLGYTAPPAEIDLAFAVAASACFPPLFGPLGLPVPTSAFTGGAYREPDRERILGRLALTDGGVYDNLGLEPALRGHAQIIVSDAGGPFPFVASRAPILRYMRYPSLVMKQVSSLRRRQLMSLIDDQRFHCEHDGPHCRVRLEVEGCPHRDDPRCRDHQRSDRVTGGAYLGIDGDVSAYRPSVADGPWSGYSRDLVRTAIARVRTDLDRFTAAEQGVLENHGYSLADAALRRHRPGPPGPDPPPLRPPHPGLIDEPTARRALATSHRRLSLRRLLERP